MASLNPSDDILKTYDKTNPPVKDAFLSERVQLNGRFYAVKKDDAVVIKSIFVSFRSFFTFLYSVVFNQKNTFLSAKKINREINSLTADTTNVVGSSILNPPSPETQKAIFEEKYYDITDKTFPFMDGWFSNLKSVAQGGALDVNVKTYLLEEADGILEMIERKQKEVKSLGKDPSVASSIKELQGFFSTMQREVKAFKKELKNEKPSGVPVAVAGIKNAGNSCYMNSALQGLFSSSLIRSRIREYPGKDLRYMNTLRKFLASYEAYENDPKKTTSNAIGNLAAQLRREIYEDRLEPLGLERLTAMADADLILMVLAQPLGLEYTFVTRRSAEGGMVGDEFIEENIARDVSAPQLLWPEIKTSGQKKEPSLQEVFDQQCRLASKERKLGWKTETASGTEVLVNDANICYRIQGDPPPLLAFKVGRSTGERMDGQFTPYAVQKRDELLDISKAFDAPPENGAQYRLIAILENHARIHWTAKSLREGCWYDCNDNAVRPDGPEIPNVGAAVMLYERIE